MPTSKAQLEAIKRSKKKTQKNYLIVFHRTNDADIIERLDAQVSKTDYIRQLIRKDIKKGE